MEEYESETSSNLERADTNCRLPVNCSRRAIMMYLPRVRTMPLSMQRALFY